MKKTAVILILFILLGTFTSCFENKDLTTEYESAEISEKSITTETEASTEEGRNTNFKSEADMVNFLKGTWENTESHTYIVLEDESEKVEEEIKEYGYNYCIRLSNLREFNSLADEPDYSLMLYSKYEHLFMSDYYCYDNFHLFIGDNNHPAPLVFTCYDFDINTKKASNGNENYQNIITILGNDRIKLEFKEGDKKIVNKYKFVSESYEWYFDQTRDKWRKAADEEKVKRDADFQVYKNFALDFIKDKDIENTAGNTKDAKEFLDSGYSSVLEAYGISSFTNGDNKTSGFLLGIAYFDYCFDKGTKGHAIGESGWKLIEAIILRKGNRENYSTAFENAYREGFGEDIQK